MDANFIPSPVMTSVSRITLFFVISLTNLMRFVVAQCRCGTMVLSEDLFSDIVNDVGCNPTSDPICCVNGTAVEPETYGAVKAYNCSSECFNVFGMAPVPAVANFPPTSQVQKSGLPLSALIAIILGILLSSLFVLCMLCICLRKRKRLKKKHNRVVTTETDARIRDDLRVIITRDAPSISSSQEGDIKESSLQCTRMTQNNHSSVSGRPSSNDDADSISSQADVEYEAANESPPLTIPAHNQSHTTMPNRIEITSHPIDIVGSPEYDTETSQDPTTSLDRYLQSQGFTMT